MFVPRVSSIHDLIAHHARTSADAIALLAPERAALGYGDFWSEVQRNAAALSAAGFARGDRIALVIPDGPELVVAFIATTAVAAAAPLNPSYRETEFDFYLSDLKATALMVPAGFESPAIKVARSRDIPILWLHVAAGARAGACTISADSTASPLRAPVSGSEDVALFLHTSGTTSRPKLVPLSQTNVAVSALNTVASLELSANDRCLNVMPLFHVHGLVGAALSSIAAGGSVICTPGFRGPEFFEWMTAFRPTWYTAVPTIHQALVDRSRHEPVLVSEHSLRLVRSCSAALSPGARLALEQAFRVPVVEAYGMTEACHQMASTPLGIGRQKPGSVGPAAGPEIAVMDEAGVMVPAGGRGEIVIRGANVTAGYEDNPAANAAAFTNGWFRTGDEGFLDEDAYLHITGRLKEIINRGGEKISPREVDEVLAAHPAVDQAVAFGIPDKRLGEDVAAAIVLRAGMQATERELREFASSRLADFKVPTRIVMVDAIPKGPTGKLQRVGLAATLGLLTPQFRPAAAGSDKQKDEAALTPLERAIAAVFADVLGVTRVGRHDSFFDLGGDSLLAVQVLSHLRDVLNVDLKLIDLFDGKTVAAMAEAVKTTRTQLNAAQPLTRLPEPAKAPLSFSQQRLWFFTQWAAGSPAYHHPIAIRLTGPLDQDALQRGLNALLERHSVLRAAFPHEAGQPRQVIASSCVLPLDVLDYRDLPVAARDKAAMTALVERARRPFDIARAPLMRSVLVRLADADHLLLISMHHLISDGWSNRPLLRDLSAFYNAFRTGAPAALPLLPIQYPDFASWQIERLNGGFLESQLAYWRQQLASPLPVLALPTDQPRPDVQNYNGARQSLHLAPELCAAVREFARQEGVTLFMVHLAAFQTLLARYANQDDIVVGTPVAGRTHSATEELVGCFVNTLAMRADLSGNPTFRELLARVRTVTLGAYAHQDVPFEKLVEALQPDRSPGRSPIFQVTFNFRNYPREGVSFADLRMEPVEVNLGVSPFDLTLEVEEVLDNTSAEPATPGLLCRLDYNTDLFEAETAGRFLFHFAALLDGVVRGPDRSIWQLGLSPTSERSAVKIRPASSTQQRLWFLDRLEPGMPTYNIPLVFRLSGPIDLDALGKSLQAIVSRHEVLRTSFEARDREPVQIIAGESAFTVGHIDLSARPQAERENEACRMATEEVSRPFDLAAAPLMRGLLLRLDRTEHVLVLTIHHIICDGWSLNVLVRELAVFYEAFSADATVPLEPLPIQYGDYIASERDRLSDDVLERQLSYWKTRLGSPIPVLELPIDRARSAAFTSNGDHHLMEIPRSVLGELKSLGRTERVTLFMTLLAVFQALLSRYGTHERILVGTAIGGRGRTELEPLIGLFINTVVFSADFSGDPTFRELLRQVREAALGVFENQDLPFDRLVTELEPERHPGVSPLVQAAFVFEEEPAPLKLKDLSVTSMPVRTATAKFDLELTITERADGPLARFGYRTDLFDASTIARIAGHFEALLAGVIAEPDRRVSELPLLTAAERKQLLVDWNQTAVPQWGDRCIHELFERQAEQRPDAVALEFDERRVTYGDLNRRANQLAHYLQARGVGPETLVAVCLERSVEMVVALLGILKAGGAYVPLDLGDPEERRAVILRDTNAPLVLTIAALRDLCGTGPATIVCLDTGWSAIEQASTCNLTSGTTPESLAYVMFTSGSTGVPKGVSVIHRGVVRLFVGTSYARFGPDEKILHASPVGFDVSTFEIWGALVHGACLVLLPARKQSLVELGRELQHRRITMAWFTADLFHQMVDHQLPALRAVPQVLAGGDVVSVSHVRKFFQMPGSGTLTNGYGPTENTTFTCCHVMKDAEGLGESVPIGRPIANTQVYVLDRHQRPVPIGVAGELYAGGAGLARGYWNRPDLTAAAFIDTPFAGAMSSRLYRTGDRVRYRPDGQLEFLGRSDRQVKIRGFRIELEAVEAALATHPAVHEVAVVAREDPSAGKRLVAYVAGPAASLSTTELRQHVARTMPGYAVPSTFVFLDHLPVNARGKIDLAALPAVDGERPNIDTSFVGPRNSLEEQIAGVWRQVLKLERVGVHDDFFDLGGHSLLAVQVMAHIETLFGRSLTLAILFEASTIAQLAQRIAESGDVRSWSTVVPIEPAGSRPPFFCIHGGGGNVLVYASLARHLRPDQPVYGVQAVGLNPEHAPHTDIETMAAHYIRDMRTVQPCGPYYLGGFSFGGVVAFEMACQLRDQGEDIELLALFDAFPSGYQRSLGWRVRLANYVRRARYHAGELAGAKRGAYVKARLKTARRRVRERVWDVRSLPYRVSGRELPPILRRVSEINKAAHKNYKPRSYDGRVTLFTARERPIDLDLGNDLGWGQYAPGGVEVHQVPGDHLSLLKEPAVGILAEQLRACLGKVRE